MFSYKQFLLIASTTMVIAYGNAAGTRILQSCNEVCSAQGACASGQINVCHEGKENECIDSSEWNEHCSDFGDTCGSCPTSDSGGSASCFSADATVFVKGKGAVSMKDAQVGDLILTSQDMTSFEPIYAFGHIAAKKTGSFLKIATDKKEPIEITSEHLLRVVGKDHPVRASSVKVGDSLEAASEDGTFATTLVTKISTVTKKGLYAPLTPSGNIMVNGIMASSYIALQDTDEYAEFGSFLKIAHQDLVQLTLAPMRVVCMGITNKPCQVYDGEGIPIYIRWGMDFIEMITQGNFIATVALAFFALPLLLAFVALEGLSGAPFALAAFAIGTVVKLSGGIGVSMKMAVKKVKQI